MTIDLRVLRCATVDSADLQEVISCLGYQLKAGIGSHLDDDKMASDGSPPPKTVEGGDPRQRRGQFQKRVRARHEVVFQLREFKLSSALVSFKFGALECGMCVNNLRYLDVGWKSESER